MITTGPAFPAAARRPSGKDLVRMAGGDDGKPTAGRLIQPTLWRTWPRQADGRPRRGPVVLDRRQERAAIDRVLDAVRGGFSGTLVLRGGIGTGKTTMLEYAVDSA